MMNSSNNPPTLGKRKKSSPCAACAYSRRACEPNCLFRPYLPNDVAENRETYINIHKLFGQANALKMLRDLQPDQRDDAMKSIVFEANAWAKNPGQGCVYILNTLIEQLHVKETELQEVRQLLAYQESLNQTSSSSSGPQSTSCAACAYESRTCEPECPFRLYFPNNDDKDRAAYIKVQKLFPYDYVLNKVREEPQQKDQVMQSIIFEANIWDTYPGQGCLHVVNDLEAKLYVHSTQRTSPTTRQVRGQTNQESLGGSSMNVPGAETGNEAG